jgi:DNA-binding GntR family transcriptional regulator
VVVRNGNDLYSFATGVVQQDTLGERVAQALRRAIILRELPPGLHIPEPVLAERYGVSRLPVRDALSQLEHEGLIRIEPRRGAFVVGFTEEDLDGVYDCRRVLESHAVRRAASRADAQGIADLQAVADEMQAGLFSSNTQQVASTDIQFHRRIVRMSGNRMLCTAWEPLAGLIATIVSITDVLIMDLASAVGSHQTLIQALAEHDEELAETLMRRHLVDGEVLMHDALKQMQDDAASLPPPTFD